MSSLSWILPFAHLDEAFNLVIYEQQHGSIHFDEDRLLYLHYNPLVNDTQLTLSNNLDPDLNSIGKSNFDCDYYVEDKFNMMINQQ